MIRLVLLGLLLLAVTTAVGVVVHRYNAGRQAIADREALCAAVPTWPATDTRDGKAVHEAAIDPCDAESVAGFVEQLLSRIGGLDSANDRAADVAQNLATKLLLALQQNERIRLAGDDAVRRQKAARAEAEKRLATFVDRYARRTPTCNEALQATATACPELEGY